MPSKRASCAGVSHSASAARSAGATLARRTSQVRRILADHQRCDNVRGYTGTIVLPASRFAIGATIAKMKLPPKKTSKTSSIIPYWFIVPRMF